MSKRNDKSRVPCPYPMSMFHNFMDEVPDTVRTSTPEDCNKCKDGCSERHCLIQEVIMNAQLENLLTYISNPLYDVFWVDTTVKGDMLHRLALKFRRTDDELKAFFDDKTGKYIDLYGVDFNDIKVFKAVDWLI